ncbi:MAG: hypothetical protein KF770_26390 [Anaerolineae bacterium]|nr:hypothetical protein [Anaerolineae bacterium]
MSEESQLETEKAPVDECVDRFKKPFRLSILGWFLGFGLMVLGDTAGQNASIDHVGNSGWVQQSILTSIGFLMLSISGIVFCGITMIIAWRSNDPDFYFTVMRRLVGNMRNPFVSDVTNLQMARFLPLAGILIFGIVFFSGLLSLTAWLLHL